tara:strand:+ start:1468 stop:1800 length:333 start_codon:yes stop_codon:yes gene_type:complete
MKKIVKNIKKTCANRKGDFAEYYAVTWLWDNGYEVFQNSGCSGPVDMIAMDKKGKIILIDVKTLKKDNRYKPKSYNCTGHTRTKKQISLGVQILLFHPETRDLRFSEHKE